MKKTVFALMLLLNLNAVAKEMVEPSTPAQRLMPNPQYKLAMKRLKGWIPYIREKDFVHRRSWQRYQAVKKKVGYAPDKFKIDSISVVTLNNGQWIANTYFENTGSKNPSFLAQRFRVRLKGNYWEILCYEPRFAISDTEEKRIKLKLGHTLCG